MATFNHLIRFAGRLGQVETGSPKADRAIHDALGRERPMLAHTCQLEAARLLLPTGFEWRDATYSSGLVYASCPRQGIEDGFPHPHHGQWEKTSALAMCRAVMRAHAALLKWLTLSLPSCIEAILTNSVHKLARPKSFF